MLCNEDCQCGCNSKNDCGCCSVKCSNKFCRKDCGCTAKPDNCSCACNAETGCVCWFNLYTDIYLK